MTQILGFALILLRIASFCVSAPVLGTNQVPNSMKILFALLMSSILFPQIAWNKMNVDLESMQIVTLAVKEVAVGLIFGFIARMFFMTISMAGQIISVSLGLSAAQLFNPSIGESSSAFDQFYGVLAILFFFAIQGHHMLVGGLFGTYSLIPIDVMTLNFDAFQSIAPIVQTSMGLALKLCAPVMISILVTNLAVAVIGRAVPQINILITSLPVNVLVGLFVVFISMPLMIWQMSELMEISLSQLFGIMKSL